MVYIRVSIGFILDELRRSLDMVQNGIISKAAFRFFFLKKRKEGRKKRKKN